MNEAARLARESFVFAMTRRVTAAFGRWLGTSLAATAVRAAAGRFAQLTIADRRRFVGVLLLTAAGTNAVLLLFVSRQMAPAPPFAMPAIAGAAGLLVILRASR